MEVEQKALACQGGEELIYENSLTEYCIDTEENALAFFNVHTVNYDAAKDFLRQRRIIKRTPPACGWCNNAMTEVKVGRGDDKTWRCPKHKGSKESLRKDSFLQGQHISFVDFIHVVLMWAQDIPSKRASERIG